MKIMLQLMAVFLLGAAAPQPALLPGYSVGDAFIFNTGRVEHVLAIKNNVITWGGIYGENYDRDANFIVPILRWTLAGTNGKRTIHNHPDSLWPLHAGGRTHFRVVTDTTAANHKTARSAGLWTCIVGAPHETVIKPGTFNVLPITCERYSNNSMRLLERLSWDYAPDLGHYVRRTWTDYYSGNSDRFELIAALHGPAATPARLQALAEAARKNYESGKK